MLQAVLQARWPDEASFMQLPHVTSDSAAALTKAGYKDLTQLVRDAVGRRGHAATVLQAALGSKQATDDCLQARSTQLQR